MGQLSSLSYLDLGVNKLIGEVPQSYFSYSRLQVLGLEENNLSGYFPSSIYKGLPNIEGFYISKNHFHGKIPSLISNLSELSQLELVVNSNAICNLGNLYPLNLKDNNLVGQLPSCLGNLSSLRVIGLADNALNFTIPSTLWFDEHVEVMDFYNNFLHGPIPVEIGKMKVLRDLYLEGNQLSGKIPSRISELQKLNDLWLSNTKLNGSIPESFVDLKDLQNLDFSQNHLSGHIPTSLEKLTNLNYLNVSFNELSGEIPDGGPFLNFSPELFVGNKGLCGVPRFKVGACKGSKSTPSSKKKLFKYIIPRVSSVVAAALILIFVLRRRTIKLLPSSQSDLPLVVMPERMSYYDILRATNNLNEKTLLREVFNLDVQSAFKSFDTQCEILRSIRHRNLVKVITSCSNLDFKALVMAYMPNGNLESWLHSNDCSLNIFKRLGTMTDVASVVEYLHEGYTSPIVHCDLKPNNILLDEEMAAHVGDFGIAKLLTQEQRMLQTTTLGTIEYIVPEYGSEGLVSTMVDVYGYGILLMEVFTRRRPTDEMFSGELTLRRWVSESLRNSVMQIIDRELLNTDDQRSRGRHEACLTSAMELAVECTKDKTDERPNMKDVVTRMNKIKFNLTILNR